MESSEPSRPASDPDRRAWVAGILMGLVLTVAMAPVWRYWSHWALVWLLLFSFVIAPILLMPQLRKRSTGKMILIALCIGTYLSPVFH
jgi:hypothetical protein